MMPINALVASTEDDSHIWNLTGVEYILADYGFEVTNLGACTPAVDIAEYVQARRPELVAISSVNGHGAITGLSLAQTLAEYQAFQLSTIIIGGKLTLSAETAHAARPQLLAAGFAGVFDGERAWAEFDEFIRSRGIAGLRAA